MNLSYLLPCLMLFYKRSPGWPYFITDTYYADPAGQSEGLKCRVHFSLN